MRKFVLMPTMFVGNRAVYRDGSVGIRGEAYDEAYNQLGERFFQNVNDKRAYLLSKDEVFVEFFRSPYPNDPMEV